MVPERLIALFLCLPLIAMIAVSIRYFLGFGKQEKQNNKKQEIAYNRVYLSLLGVGFFSIWFFWLGGMILMFLNRYYDLCSFLTLPILRVPVIQIIGIVLFYLGTIFLIWTLYYAGKYLRPSIAGVYADHKLIQDGPLGIVRNPYYVSYVLILVSLILILSSILPLLFTIFVVVGMYPAAKAEEEQMSALFGDEFFLYTQKVGRFFPKIAR